MQSINHTINRIGLAEIHDFLGRTHKAGRDHFTLAMLSAWAHYDTDVEAAHELLVPTALDALPEDDEEAALAALERETTVLTFDGGILVREF